MNVHTSHVGPGSSKASTEEGGANQNESLDGADEEMEGEDEDTGGGTDKGNRPGAKPHLRVYIPGQKEFVPRTVSFTILYIALCFEGSGVRFQLIAIMRLWIH